MKITKKNIINNTELYWDMTIPKNNNYVLSNGMVVHNTGVGFGVERDSVAKLPTIAEEFSESDTTIVIQDSKLGWAKAYRELISLLVSGQIPKWDLSKIRPAGARLKTFGGRASGPQPLDDLFRFTVETFRRAAGRKLTSIECHDIVCKIAEIVVVGGVRRSALISLSSLTDERLREAKSGAWWEANPQRALANNSVAYKETPEIGTFMEEWISLYKSKSGERGIFNRAAAKNQCIRSEKFRKDTNYPVRNSNFEFGTNPCCLPGETLIETNMGQIPIHQIVLSPDDYLIKTLNHQNNNVELSEIISADLTRPNAELIEIEILNDKNELITLRLTPDHMVFTDNRGYVRADNLSEEDVVVISDNYTYSTGINTGEKVYESGHNKQNNGMDI